ncbi:MAG: two-component system sensor histidine kinase CpxA [Paraglaciecola sp.]|jgi:two-component system sensor histidine kinase CpxA
MSGWARLNPLRSLYGRIFLWFWLVTIVMVSGAGWIVKNISTENEYQPINQKQLRLLNSTGETLQRLLAQKKTKRAIEHQIKRYSQRHNLNLVLLDPQNKQQAYAFPMPGPPQHIPFVDLIEQDSPLGITTRFGEFFGPKVVTIKGHSYQLFVGKRRPMGLAGKLRRGPPLLLVAMALLISGVLCFLIARSLIKPLQELQKASQKMAAGELGCRVGSASTRQDEIGQLGRDFNHMSQQVESLLKGQKQLLADISHELRSPLTRMQLAIGIAQQQDAPHCPAISAMTLARIEKEAQQIEHMVAQVLTLSRLDSEMTKPDIQPLDLHELLSDVFEDCYFEAQSMGKKLSLDCPDELTLQADGELLASAFENILRNGIKYARHHVTIEVKTANGHVEIVFCDDGPGIPEQDLSNVFIPFYRVSAARDRKSGGVGLGLAIASRAVKAHHGSIAALTPPAGGLQVTITLPMTAPA